MNKTDLIASMAEKSGLKKKDAESALNSFMESIKDNAVKGENTVLVGFGSFNVKQRTERKGRNPQTKTEITIPASRALTFSVGKPIKDAMNK